MKQKEQENTDSSVLITGVSSGIGFAAAQEFIEHGFHVFGSVRSKMDAGRLAEELGSDFTPLIFDVRDGEAIAAAARTIENMLQGKKLDGLVNNVGVAVSGPLMHISPKEFSEQFDINVTGVLRVVQAFLPMLGAGKNFAGRPGRIVNISSVSGRIAFPFIGPYAASKHALEALSDALRRELMMYNIDVIVIEPGNTETPIWEKAKARPAYQDTDYAEVISLLRHSLLDQPKSDALDAHEVGRIIRLAVCLPNPKTRYLILKRKFMGWYLPRLLPDRWLDRIVAKRLGMI
jgi:NAD(P)-dependent dehydrogenase (short-subunit alcohol dehydrogenase family)